MLCEKPESLNIEDKLLWSPLTQSVDVSSLGSP